MIELLLPYVFDTLKYSWVKATIDIYTLTDYFVAKKHQQRPSKGGRHHGKASTLGAPHPSERQLEDTLAFAERRDRTEPIRRLCALAYLP
jgi:hypothetical protein